MGRVANKVAIITGGASGLGLASARRLAEEGAEVVIADVNLEQGQAAAKDIPGSCFEVLDVTREANWIALVDKVMAQYGRLDILLNSAGIVRLASIEDTTEEMWRRDLCCRHQVTSQLLHVPLLTGCLCLPLIWIYPPCYCVHR